MNIDQELLEEVLIHLIRSGELRFETQLRDALRNAESSDIAEFYRFLKEHGQRFESEWRDSFLSIFPKAAAVLPPIDDRESWLKQLVALIEAGELDKVSAFLDQIGLLKVKLDPDEALREGTDVGFNEEPSFRPFELYPLDSEDADGFKPADYAESLGQMEIASYLCGVVAEVDGAWKAAYRQGWAKNAAKIGFELLFTADNKTLHMDSDVSVDEAIRLAKTRGATKLKGVVSVKADPRIVASYVNAFAAAGIPDNEISLMHES